MKHIHNVFPKKNIFGTFNIKDGSISLSDIKDGQYFLIENSYFNDGVYKYPVNDLIDEEFTGSITLLAPPKEFLALVDDIQVYCKENVRTGLQSESFGGYSYTKASGANGTIADWTDVFKQRLNAWRKI